MRIKIGDVWFDVGEEWGKFAIQFTEAELKAVQKMDPVMSKRTFALCRDDVMSAKELLTWAREGRDI